MLVKTNEKTTSGKDIYVNAISRSKGILGIVDQFPSMRRERRDAIYKSSTKVKTNRRATPGRLIHYQTITMEKTEKKPVVVMNKKGMWQKVHKNVIIKTVKTIKHIQETNAALKRKYALLEFQDRVARNKSKNDKSKKED